MKSTFWSIATVTLGIASFLMLAAGVDIVLCGVVGLAAWCCFLKNDEPKSDHLSRE